MLKNTVIFFVTLLYLSCGKSNSGCSKNAHEGLSPGGSMVLSPTNNTCSGISVACEAKDEDSSIMLAQDGTFYMTWMSNRDKYDNDDIYILSSKDGISWSDPVRITSHADSDTYPTLIEYPTSRGRFHLVWTRMQIVSPFARHVYFNSSSDGVQWSQSTEVAVTSGTVDDFVPYLFQKNDRLLIYFDNLFGRSVSGTRDIFLTQSTDGGATWSTPSALDGINSNTEMDSFPFVAQRSFSNDLILVGVRYSSTATGSTAYLDASTDIFYSTSSDGLVWSSPALVTLGDSPDTTVDTIPSFYVAGTKEVFTWLKGVNSEAHVMEVDLTFPSTYPVGLIDVTSTNGVPGYSPRVTPTLKMNTYLRTWVSNSKKIYYQVFEK